MDWTSVGMSSPSGCCATRRKGPKFGTRTPVSENGCFRLTRDLSWGTMGFQRRHEIPWPRPDVRLAFNGGLSHFWSIVLQTVDDATPAPCPIHII